MAVAHPYSFALEVCEIFGLNPSQTKSITITIIPDDLVIVKADLILFDEQAKQIISTAKTLTFKPYAKDEENTEATDGNING